MREREGLPEYLQLLPEEFYTQESLLVAPSLIGCVIETNKEGVKTSGRITETEAYPSYDAASHAFEGRRTPRTEIQFSKGGGLYIYKIMGLHLMTSIVVGKEETADVVFIRSIEPLIGIDRMRERRKYFGDDERRIASGPGTLSVALGITKADNGLCVYDKSSSVKIYKDNSNITEIETGLRINLGVHGRDEEAGKRALDQEWRFFERGSNYLSK